MENADTRCKVWPETGANLFSRLSFFWVQQIFSIGNKRPLTEDDIFPIEPRLRSERLTALLEQQFLEEAANKKNPSLLLTLFKRHRWTLAWMFVASVIEAVFRCTVPFLVAKIASYFDPSVEMTRQTALGWTGALFLVYIGMTSFRPSLYYRMERLGTSIRIAVSGLVYRKACRITQKEIGDRSVGLILNLITNDAQRLDQYIVSASILMSLWAVLGISFTIMYYQLGIYATLAGFLASFLFVPLQVYIGKCILNIRKNTAPLTDSRVKTVHEIILFMKVIKMYGWELMFRDIVTKMRLKESVHIGKFILMKTLNMALYFNSSVLSLLLVVMVKKLSEDPITTSQVLFCISMMGVLRAYINVFLGDTFIYIPQVIHSLQRIQDFLNADEIQHLHKKAAIMNLADEVIVNRRFIHYKDVQLKRQNGYSKTGIKNDQECDEQFPLLLNPITKPSSVERPNRKSEKFVQTTVFGPQMISDSTMSHDMGTGNPEKSVFITHMSCRWGADTFALSGIDLTIRKGELIAVVGPVACGKTTLLMSLLQELDHEGWLKISGNVGFSSQVPWIFNGNIQENIVFNRPLDEDKLKKCIESCYLKKDLELFPNGLQTVVGERGVQLSGGQRTRVNLARAAYGEDSIILLDDPLSAVDSRCAKHIFNKLIKEQLFGKTRILVTHSSHFLSEVDRIVVMAMDHFKDSGKKRTAGKIAHIGTYSELISKGIIFSVSGSCTKRSDKAPKSTFVHSPVPEDSSESDDSDEVFHELKIDAEKVERNKPVEQVKEETKTGLLDKRLYLRFLCLGLGDVAVPIIFIALIAPQTLDIFQQQFAVDWAGDQSTGEANVTEEELEIRSQTLFHTYLGLVLSTIVLYIARAMLYTFVTNRAGRRLHNKALFSILRSPMRYFDTHPIGMTINRFSKDTYFMDECFPDVSHHFLSIFILYSASIILILIANFWFILALIPLVIMVVLTVRYYLPTSVEIRRIEAMTRSPIFSQMSAMLSGLATIRASNQIEVYELQHYKMRDQHTRAWVMFLVVSKWFAFRLDIICALICIISTFLVVVMKDVISASVAGLSIVYINNMLIGFQYCVRQYTETENIMTSVERIFGFAELPPEAPLESEAMKKTKRRIEHEKGHDSSDIANTNVGSGVLQFKNVSLKYDPDPQAEYILHGISFLTRPFEKIGIVGRTGAGKSSILQALFRIAEPDGEILLDGMLTSEMGLHELRKSISIIPQESLLFSESLRVNLDPFLEFSDEELWAVLEKVELKSYVLTATGGLEMLIQEGGGNLSAGQRQLLCLARALLRDNKFLVIDEATANVDEATDRLIQRTLREKFSKCTVLTIAHRINTIIDSDRVMVIHEGHLVEFEQPAELLRRPESLFYDLAQETGIFDILFEQAKLQSEK